MTGRDAAPAFRPWWRPHPPAGAGGQRHAWKPYPWSDDSHVFDVQAGSSIRQDVFNGFGPMGISLELKARGQGRVPLDYLIRSQASFLFDGGLWGILRVTPPGSPYPPVPSTPAAPD